MSLWRIHPFLLGLPGSYPFTRRIYPNMYRGKLWTMRMFSGFWTPEDTNRRLKYLIDAGLDPAEFAPRLSFFFNSSINFFEEIAKLRACQKLC